MSYSGAAIASPGPLARALKSAAAWAARHLRLSIALGLVLIFGSFASAGALQLRWERGRALADAGNFETRRAREIAADLSDLLSRYAALGRAFADASGAETAAALSDAGGAGLSNIVVLDNTGAPLSQLKSAPDGLLPLRPEVILAARRGHAAIALPGGQMAILFADAGRLIAVELDLGTALRAASLDQALIADPDGQVIDLGARWEAVPAVQDLQLHDARSDLRTVTAGGMRRLVALRKVPGWPLVAGASVPVGAALSDFYASLPLFLLLIFGPAAAGAALAVVFVRAFERRAKAMDAAGAIRARGQSEARLLIRLADAERRAAEAERSRSEFIAHMSHELRTPLNAIIGFSEVIAGGYFGEPGHPKYLEYARDITRAGKDLHGKIGDVLEFANVEAGRHPITLTAIDLPEIARRVVDDAAGRAFSRRIRLSIALPDCDKARGDASAVRRILSNLLSNALEYTPEGGAVRIAARSADGAVTVAVSDTGQGFSADEQALAGRAFTRFDRPGAVTGLGMGLAIAMALARAMGGVLRLAGAPGQGTTAELRLPKL